MAKGYTDRKRFTEKQIQAAVRQVDTVTRNGKTMFIRSLVDLLYGPEADENWGADTLDELAQLLGKYNLVP